ncbi:hypothetical protein ACFL5Y_02960, partial [Candidatus Omnitrophota bacterium]
MPEGIKQKDAVGEEEASADGAASLRRREEELEAEIRSFEKERKNIRNIVGRLGGTPSAKGRVINIIFIILVLAVFAMS